VANSVEAYDLLKKIRMNLSALQAQVTDLYGILNELDIRDSERPRCPSCGLTFKGAVGLAEHRYISHGGEVPAHWVEAEARSVA
jgi:hypothetical protein